MEGASCLYQGVTCPQRGRAVHSSGRVVLCKSCPNFVEAVLTPQAPGQNIF